MQHKNFNFPPSESSNNQNKSSNFTQNSSYKSPSNLLELLKAKKGQNINIDISMIANKGSLTNLIEKAKKYQIPLNPYSSRSPQKKITDIKYDIKEENNIRKSKIEILQKFNKIKIGNINKNKNSSSNNNYLDSCAENSEDTNERTSNINSNNLNNESRNLSQKNMINYNNGFLSNETSSSGALTKLDQFSNKEKSDNLSHEEEDIESYSSNNKEKELLTNFQKNPFKKIYNNNNNLTNNLKNFANEYETVKESYFIESCNCVLEYSFREDQNIDSQIAMEDKSKSIENFNNNKNQILFELFDGHGGEDISNFLQQNFVIIYKNYLENFNYDIPKSLTHAFKEADETIKESLTNLEGMGSTGTIVHILWENDITLVVYTGNVGDSRVSLISKNHIIRLSYDHRMSDQKEKERIIQSGLEIINDRIGGELMLTRVFGDYEFKSISDKKKGVICEPFLSKIKIDLNIKNQFLILASDGIWDLISEKEIQQMIGGNSYINSEKLCAMIIKKALDKDSWDNMSIFAIKLT
jgi:serine/threonine protein phosphatase PrpC